MSSCLGVVQLQKLELEIDCSISNVTFRIVIPIVGKEAMTGIKYDRIRLFTHSGERIHIILE
jgi:hypothetical protein